MKLHTENMPFFESSYIFLAIFTISRAIQRSIIFIRNIITMYKVNVEPFVEICKHVRIGACDNLIPTYVRNFNGLIIKIADRACKPAQSRFFPFFTAFKEKLQS